jgi:hypothetical protein
MKGRGWPLIVGALLAGAAPAGACRQERDRALPPPVELARAAPVTDLGAIVGQDGPDLAGRPAQISGASVQDVVDERVFWIGPGDTRRVLVVVGQPVNVKRGQTVNLTGTVERVPSDPEGLRPLDLAQQAEDLLRIQIVYIKASSTIQAE